MPYRPRNQARRNCCRFRGASASANICSWERPAPDQVSGLLEIPVKPASRWGGAQTEISDRYWQWETTTENAGIVFTSQLLPLRLRSRYPRCLSPGLRAKNLVLAKNPAAVRLPG